MKQINNFDNSRLHNQEDFNFLTRVRDLAAALLTLETDKAMVDSFTAAVSAYDAALKQSDKNSTPPPSTRPTPRPTSVGAPPTPTARP